MAQYQILYWHDIPVQVKARDGRQRASQPLSNRFQEAIDRAAMAAGLVGSDEYTDLFQWSEPEQREGTAESAAAAVASELEVEYSRIDWQKTAVSLTSNR
jgi:hypothetical protein